MLSLTKVLRLPPVTSRSLSVKPVPGSSVKVKVTVAVSPAVRVLRSLRICSSGAVVSRVNCSVCASLTLPARSTWRT